MNKLTFLVVPLMAATVLTGCSVSLNGGDDAHMGEMEVGQVEHTEASAASTLVVRSKRLGEIIHEMPKGGMAEVKEIFTDLTFVKNVAKDDVENLTDGMSDEVWMYSAKDNTTIIVCNMLDTPAHMFKGTSMTAAELTEAKAMMKEMIEMMK